MSFSAVKASSMTEWLRLAKIAQRSGKGIHVLLARSISLAVAEKFEYCAMVRKRATGPDDGTGHNFAADEALM